MRVPIPALALLASLAAIGLTDNLSQNSLYQASDDKNITQDAATKADFLIRAVEPLASISPGFQSRDPSCSLGDCKCNDLSCQSGHEGTTINEIHERSPKKKKPKSKKPKSKQPKSKKPKTKTKSKKPKPSKSNKVKITSVKATTTKGSPVKSKTSAPALTSSKKPNGQASKTSKDGRPTRTSAANASSKGPVTTPVASKSRTKSSASSSQSALSTSKLDCKAIALSDPLRERPQVRPPKRSYPIDLQAHRLEKRDSKKDAKICWRKFNLVSKNYPSSGQWPKKGFTPKKYGFNTAVSCDNYDWGRPDSTATYETEHVLEWQLVAGFFNKLGEDMRANTFDHPDPGQQIQIGFCEYWYETWNLDIHQRINEPNPPAANLPKMTRQHEPLEWLAQEYPSNKNWIKEFTLLEKELNGYKGRMFKDLWNVQEDQTAAWKPTKLRKDDVMKKLITGKSSIKALQGDSDAQSRLAVQYLRAVIGVFKYMQEDEVAEIFAKEKNRMGDIIGYLDKEVAKIPRQVVNQYGIKVTYKPWVEDGLKIKWHKYMDEVFERAKDKGETFMNTWLDALDLEWNSQKKKDEFKINPKDDRATRDKKAQIEKDYRAMLGLLRKTRTEWGNVKDWKKPANW